MKREIGFYWVRVSSLLHNWQVAAWNGKEWILYGGMSTELDEDLFTIDERRILNPGEK